MHTVEIEVRTRAARFVIAIAVLLCGVFGKTRMRRLAAWAAVTLPRYRVGRGSWQRFGPEMREHLVYCWTSHWAEVDAADVDGAA